ncbi:hypothetical protein QFZ35_000807 [Arthrobacter ulcerisalmonis]|nr:hypothetical protein [Arthrobacter ulcerisalmonis]
MPKAHNGAVEALCVLCAERLTATRPSVAVMAQIKSISLSPLPKPCTPATLGRITTAMIATPEESRPASTLTDQ